MPLTAKGRKILRSMQKQYGAKEGTSVLYASKNAGRISGIDRRARLFDALRNGTSVRDAVARSADAATSAEHSAAQAWHKQKAASSNAHAAALHTRAAYLHGAAGRGNTTATHSLRALHNGGLPHAPGMEHMKSFSRDAEGSGGYGERTFTGHALGKGAKVLHSTTGHPSHQHAAKAAMAGAPKPHLVKSVQTGHGYGGGFDMRWHRPDQAAKYSTDAAGPHPWAGSAGAVQYHKNHAERHTAAAQKTGPHQAAHVHAAELHHHAVVAHHNAGHFKSPLSAKVAMTATKKADTAGLATPVHDADRKPFDPLRAAYQGVGDSRRRRVRDYVAGLRECMPQPLNLSHQAEDAVDPETSAVRQTLVTGREFRDPKSGADAIGRGIRHKWTSPGVTPDKGDDMRETCDCAGMIKAGVRDAVGRGMAPHEAIKHAVTRHRAFHDGATGDARAPRDKRMIFLGAISGGKTVRDAVNEVRDAHLGFHKLESKLSHEKGITNPAALAAAIGRRKFGKKGMARKSAAGRDDDMPGMGLEGTAV